MSNVPLIKVALLKTHIRLYMRSGIIPARGYGIQRMLDEASKFTGRVYQRGKIGAPDAVEDLQALLDQAAAS
jgi:hypothetical protein